MSALRRGLKHFLPRHVGLSANRELGRLVTCESDHIPKLSITASRYLTTTLARNNLSGRVLINANHITQVNFEQRRFKKKRASNKQEEDEEEDDDDDELAEENPLLMDDILSETNDGSQRMTIDISSLRLDTFCKSAFSMARAKVEESFYKGDIYINGELASKKSEDLSVNDEIDIVKSIDPEDSKLIHIRRAVITKLPDKMSEHGRMKLDIQRWQDLVIESRELKGRGHSE